MGSRIRTAAPLYLRENENRDAPHALKADIARGVLSYSRQAL